MATERMTICPWCKAEMPDDSGAYYHKKRCHALAVQDRIKAAEKRGVPASDPEMRSLALELNFAEYTGD